MKKLLSKDEFESSKFDKIAGFCEYYGIPRPHNGWHSIIPGLGTLTKNQMYDRYVEWHNENFTKLATYLRSNDASKTEET